MNQDTMKLKTDKHIKKSKQVLTHRTLNGFFWVFSGKGVQIVFQLLIMSILARLIVPVDFGIIGAALIVLSLSGIFLQLGISSAIIQRPNIETRHLRTGFTICLLLGIVMTGLVWIGAPDISVFFKMDELTIILRCMAFLLFFAGISTVAQSLLQRNLRFRLLSLIDLVSFILGYGAVGVTLAFLNYGVWALVWANFAQFFLRSILAIIVQPHPKLFQLERHALSELIYFGGGFTLVGILNHIANQGDYLIVGRYLGSEALGIYGRAYKLMALPAGIFGEVLNRVLFPVLSMVQNDPKRLRLSLRRGLALIALLTLPISAIMIILAPEIIYVLLGVQWKEAVLPFQILTIGALFRSSIKVSDSLARSMGVVYRRALIHGVYALAVIFGALIGQNFGVSGVAIGVLVALCMFFISLNYLSLKLAFMTWREFSAIHLPAIGLTAIICTETWLVAHVLRIVAAPALFLLIGSTVVVLITLLILLFLIPKFAFGEDGLWILKSLISNIPTKLNVFNLVDKIEKKVNI